MNEFYKLAPDGLIGNEDCGQMSAWYVFSAAGFYPVTPGSTIYAIGTPLFPEVRFALENGKTFVVKAQGVSDRNFYIQSATLNGRPYAKSYLEHRDLMAGGELIFQLGPQPNRSRGQEFKTQAQFKTIPAPLVVAPKTFKGKIEVSIHSLANGAPLKDFGQTITSRTRATFAFVESTRERPRGSSSTRS